MINKLRTRLILMLLAITLISILSVSVITNITLFNRFGTYMEDEQKNKIQEVVEYIEASYEKYNGWNEEALYNIYLSSLMKDFDVTILDSSGKVIYNQYMDNSMMSLHNRMMENMGRGMMSKMGKGMMPWAWNFDEEYKTEKIQLKANDVHIGTLDLGYTGPFTISEREIAFTQGINISIRYAALISLIVAIVLGAFFSKFISKTILNITNASNDIRDGKLDTRITAPTKITELQELSSSINHLAVSLKEQREIRKRMTSDIAHELRTPLTILHSHIEAIYDGIWEPTQERIGIFKKEVQRLMKLVEQLKNLSDLESDVIVLEKENFNLSQLLLEVTENFQAQFHEKKVDLHVNIEENLFFTGDKDKITQILINLISNGWKFTSPQGSVTVEMKSNKKDVIIEVTDTGIGIAKEDMTYVFERFYRSDKSRSRKTGGAGIGLTITKKLVQAHHGEITLESELNKGTKFIVILPKTKEN